MDWTVEGADKLTGKSRRIVVHAGSKDEAIQHGGTAGLYVADAWPKTATVPYASPAQQAGATGTAPPSYPAITSGARLLDFFGGASIVIGVLSLCAAILAGVVPRNRWSSAGVYHRDHRHGRWLGSNDDRGWGVPANAGGACTGGARHRDQQFWEAVTDGQEGADRRYRAVGSSCKTVLQLTRNRVAP